MAIFALPVAGLLCLMREYHAPTTNYALRHRTSGFSYYSEKGLQIAQASNSSHGHLHPVSEFSGVTTNVNWTGIATDGSHFYSLGNGTGLSEVLSFRCS